MNEKRVSFWYEALKGGTVIGLVTVALALVTQFSGENNTIATIVNYLSTVVTILLAYGYTRRFGAMHTQEEGFSYGRSVGFVVSMMLFVGVISGIYSAVMANFFIREELMEVVDVTMAQMQDMLPAESFEQTYDSLRSSVTSPLILTLSSVVSNAFFGVLMGLCLGLLTRRRPDIFASTQDGGEAQQ